MKTNRFQGEWPKIGIRPVIDGMDKEGADYRACQAYGAMYK